MNELPILFNAPMVRAILDGRKTQTRRIVKAKHLPFVENLLVNFLDGKWNQRPLPYGKPGERLWVRETWMEAGDYNPPKYLYRASDWRSQCREHRFDMETVPAEGTQGWKPSIHMPRTASRILLEVTGVRIERLNDCDARDALAEGIRPFYSSGESNEPSCYGLNEERCGFGSPGSWRFHRTPQSAFRALWEHINGARAWDVNPWVWVIEFARV